MNKGEKRYHRANIMGKGFVNADVVIPIEALLDVMDCIFVVDASTRLERILDLKGLNKDYMNSKK